MPRPDPVPQVNCSDSGQGRRGCSRYAQLMEQVQGLLTAGPVEPDRQIWLKMPSYALCGKMFQRKNYEDTVLDRRPREVRCAGPARLAYCPFRSQTGRVFFLGRLRMSLSGRT